MSGSPKRILLGKFFIRSVELEGSGNLLAALAEEFALRGWQVRMVLPEGNYAAWRRWADIRTYVTGSLAGYRRYLRAITEESAQVDAALLVESSPTVVGPYRASRCPRTWIKFLTPLQSFGLFAELGFCRQALMHVLAKHPLLARLRKWSDVQCVVGSEYQARELRSLGATRVNVVPCCGISRQCPVPDRQAARRQLGWDERPVIGQVGHFSRIKGVDVLVEAFHRHNSPAVLCLAHSGKGALRPKSQALLADLARQGRVRQLGVVEPLVFLAACDVVALPYVTADIFHQPQVLVESFAAGTAVITTRLGGFPEIVEPGRTGQLVPPRDAPALAAALEQAVADLPATHAMGLNARARFQRDLSRETFADRFLSMVEDTPCR